MKTPLVSICCITFNHASFIGKCLDGFLMQKAPSSVPEDAKMSDWCEILIHDDCSTDGTTEIIKEYAAKYPDLIFPLYEEVNQYKIGGAGKMDLYNYKRVRGTYIAYCEGDDYWTEPLKLRTQVDFLETHPNYSVTFHRCKHINVIDGIEVDDNCGFLFPDSEEGIDINVNLFLKQWITQPLTMVCRVSMHDINLAYKYKYYRDMFEIYHLLKAGVGYLFGFFGGKRNVHSGGIASLRDDKDIIEDSLNVLKELFINNKDADVKQAYMSAIQWAIYSNEMGLLERFVLSIKLLFLNYDIKKFLLNVMKR